MRNPPPHFATMEALAGYGSDSSSDDSSGSAGGASGSGGGALAGLLPSDASSSEDERMVPETKAPPAAGGLTPAASSLGDRDRSAPEPAATNNANGDAEGGASSPTQKRRRRDSGGVGKKNDTTVNTCPLPPPKLSASSAGDNGGGGEQVSNAFEELIRFNKDYTAQLRPNLTAAAAAQAAGGSDKTNAKVSQQLDALHKTFYGTGATATTSGTTDDESGRPTSFALHLRHQHEFGNPNLFPSVVEQFGIVAGGSNLPNELWKASCEFRDFESCDRLMAAEEQARFRAANSSNLRG